MEKRCKRYDREMNCINSIIFYILLFLLSLLLLVIIIFEIY